MADSKTFDEVWDMHIALIKEKVRARALEIAQGDGRELAAANDIYDAMREYVPGKATSTIAPERLGWWNKNVTGFIGITAALTLLFGILGLVGMFGNFSEKVAPVLQNFLEISKIFAGALVGGAAGAATATRR